MALAAVGAPILTLPGGLALAGRLSLALVAEPEIIDLLGWQRGRDYIKRGAGLPLPPEAREWLAAHGAELAEPKDEPTERLPKLTEAPVCPYCDALGTLKRERRGLMVCSTCHVAMPWQRPRDERPDFLTRLSWKIDPDQHGDVGLDERCWSIPTISIPRRRGRTTSR